MCFVARYGCRKPRTVFADFSTLLSFAVSSTPVMLRQIFWRPDGIFVIEPTLFCAPWALVTARLANAKAWVAHPGFRGRGVFRSRFQLRRLRQKVRQRGRRLADAPVRPCLRHLGGNGGKGCRFRHPRRSDLDLSHWVVLAGSGPASVGVPFGRNGVRGPIARLCCTPAAWGRSRGSRRCWKPPGLCRTTTRIVCSCWSAMDRKKKVLFNGPGSLVCEMSSSNDRSPRRISPHC